MNSSNIKPYSKAIVKLLKGIVEKDDVVWNDVLSYQSDIQDYIAVIGLELIVKKVVIIGAGPAGITAAFELLKKTNDEYETYLGLEEYEEWSLQQSICRRLTDGQIAEAAAELERYGKQYDIRAELNGFPSEASEESAACICRLRKQFYLGMLGMLYRLQGAEPKLLADIYREAVMLTMPDVEKKPVEHMALSVRELNLLLEVSYWEQQSGHGKNAIMGANQVIRYTESHMMEDKLKVKIYTKAVCYYCRETLQEEKKKHYNEMKKAEEDIAKIKMQLAEDTFKKDDEIIKLKNTNKKYYTILVDKGLIKK